MPSLSQANCCSSFLHLLLRIKLNSLRQLGHDNLRAILLSFSSSSADPKLNEGKTYDISLLFPHQLSTPCLLKKKMIEFLIKHFSLSLPGRFPGRQRDLLIEQSLIYHLLSLTADVFHRFTCHFLRNHIIYVRDFRILRCHCNE